jgi:hypothetical protein
VSADQAPEIDGDDLDEILADDDDLLVPPCPDLQRQTTAVGTPPPTNVAGLLVDLSLESPSSVSPAVEQPIPVSPTSVPAEAADAPHVTTPPMPITERTSTPSGRSDTIASLAQTPMNEVFLSSLVINANTPRSSLPPSVHASAPTSVPASAPTSTPASGPSSRPVSGTAARPGVSPRSELDAMFVQDAAVAAAVVDDEHILDEVNNP